MVLMTNNHANVGLRLINTINHYRQFHPTRLQKQTRGGSGFFFSGGALLLIYIYLPHPIFPSSFHTGNPEFTLPQPTCSHVTACLLRPAELFIERFCMTGGNSPIGYLKAYHTNLYLSADPVKVREALEEGGCLGGGGEATVPVQKQSPCLILCSTFRYSCSHHVHPGEDGSSVGDSAARCLRR